MFDYTKIGAVKEEKTSLKHVKARLWHEMEKSAENAQSLRRIEFEIEPTDSLYWLSIQPNMQKLFWSDRQRHFEVAGLFNVMEIKGERLADLEPAFQSVQPILLSDSRFRFFGGVRFNSIHNGDESWKSFSYFNFQLPLFEMLRRDHQYFFTCNLPPDSEWKNLKLRQKIQELQFDDRKPAFALSQFRYRIDNPDESGWKQNVQKALHYLRANGLKKVVLARKSDLIFQQQPSPELVLQELKDSNPNSFLFLFQNKKGESFLGSTPERLYQRQGRSLQTEAIAGTRRRGMTVKEDRQLKNELLTCEKDLREHGYVVCTIERTLQEYCEKIEKDEHIGILENARVQHLILFFRALLREEKGDARLLQALHPTPAVGGYPTDPALYKINEMEQFDRGWYAGPVGWIGRDSAEFAVAIRSALVSGEKVSLFSGAGIVEGSEPEAEWREIENKIANFIRIFQAE